MINFFKKNEKEKLDIDKSFHNIAALLIHAAKSMKAMKMKKKK